MGFLGNLLKDIFSNSDSVSSQQQTKPYEPARRFTPLEYIIYEQEQSGEKWHGILLSELSKLAQTIYHGKYVKVDKYNFLVFYYSSRADKKRFEAQCKLDEKGRLVRLPHSYYPGQWRDSADDFVEKANQQFTFN